MHQNKRCELDSFFELFAGFDRFCLRLRSREQLVDTVKQTGKKNKGKCSAVRAVHENSTGTYQENSALA